MIHDEMDAEIAKRPWKGEMVKTSFAARRAILLKKVVLSRRPNGGVEGGNGLDRMKLQESVEFLVCSYRRSAVTGIDQGLMIKREKTSGGYGGCTSWWNSIDGK